MRSHCPGSRTVIYFVRELGVSDSWLGLWAACVSGGVIIGNVIWQRVIERYGTARTLVSAWLPNTIYFVLIALFPNPPVCSLHCYRWPRYR